MISEIDPFSTLPLRKVDFAPYDLLRQSQTSLRPMDEAGVIETFLASVQAIYNANTAKGRRVVIRDHTHSHFCMDIDPAERPLMREMLSKRFRVCSVVSVRHPLDSFLSLRRNGWVMYEPDTVEEYCRRYHLFLDAYADAPVFRYEDFIDDPDTVAQMIARRLELPFVAHWRDTMPIIELSGDSGRKSDEIAKRPRREIDDSLKADCKSSQTYQSLCIRLEYDSAPDAPPGR